ncbi:hypothetical protein [Spirobacillus cienkowskii]|uniref:Methyltransferase n=1 Tax=Spirobacillus cienkowskii TaxID=495820 RepID=A0A369KUD9_9BACT|nr:MAG: hypothetical protein DCC88_04780 [Spirobacillus cienkowskii]
MPRPVIDHHETNDCYTIRVTKPSLKYIDFFLKLKCSAELVATGFYPNGKEISETQGAFEAIRHKLKLNYLDNSVAIVVVGDGYNPRTGYYIACMTNWQIFSVDPAMTRDYKDIVEKIKKRNNIKIFPQPIEECEFDISQFKTVVLLFVHSHASLKASVNSLKNSESVAIHAVSMPCCFDDDLGIPYNLKFDDPFVVSVHRTLFIYKNILQHFS